MIRETQRSRTAAISSIRQVSCCTPFKGGWGCNTYRRSRISFKHYRLDSSLPAANADDASGSRKVSRHEFRTQRDRHLQLTQAGVENLTPAVDLGEPVPDDELNEFYAELKRSLGIELRQNRRSGERSLYIGAQFGSLSSADW